MFYKNINILFHLEEIWASPNQLHTLFIDKIPPLQTYTAIPNYRYHETSKLKKKKCFYIPSQ